MINKETGGYLPFNSNPGKKTLVLDMDETLIYADFDPTFKYERKIEVVMDGKIGPVYLSIRPGVSEFLERMSKLYELVIFTASLPSYASPIINTFDADNRISFRLYRKHWKKINGTYVKDLSKLGRPLKDVILIDNSPLCYMLQRENGLPIKTW